VRAPAGHGELSLWSSDASGGFRISSTGVWRLEAPCPTAAQRRVLAELARGDSLTIDQTGEI
jgi:hypothetical protein